ncbi:MAG: YfhO family protein, partial [Anaerolineae bacterium]
TRALHRRSIVWAIVAAVPFGLMIQAGHTPTFVLLALGAGIVVVFEAVRPAVFFTAENAESAKIPNVSAFSARSAVDQAAASALARDWRKINARSAIAALGLFGLTALVGVALAAVQILPALTFVENSARVAGVSAEFASRFSLPPLHLLQMLIPDFFGEPVQAGYWSVPVFEEYIYYVGVPTLILATLSIFTRDARARFFVAFGVFGLIVALGPDGVVYTILYRFVPLFDLLRAPARAGLWTIFSFAAAAGLCLSAIQTSGVDAAKRILSKWSRWPIAVGVGAGLIGAGIAYAQFASSASAPDSGRFYHLAGDMLVFVLLCAAASALIRAWSARIDRAHVWAASLAALLLIDLGVYHVNLVQMVPSTRGAPYAAADRALGDRLKEHRLIWVYADLFELNLGMDFGQYNVYGYDSLITARLQALVDRASDLSSPIYDMLNVRYVIAEPPLVEKVERVGEADGFTFYERPAKRIAPRAWIVRAIESVADDEAALDRVAADFDPQVAAVVVGAAPCTVEAQVGADSVSIVRYEPNRIEARVETGAAGLLVFSEIDYPGWAASIDGAPAAIHRVDYGLRGVCLPQGSHGVTLVYDPPELKVGVVVSLAAISLIVLSGVALIRPRKLSRQN